MQTSRSALLLAAGLAVVVIAVATPWRVALGEDVVLPLGPETSDPIAVDLAPLSTWTGQEVTTTPTSPLDDGAKRQQRIERDRPAPSESILSFVPPNVLARLNLRFGSLLERLGLDEAARNATARAIGFGETGSNAWRRLAILRIHSGEAESAEGAFLAAIDRADEQLPATVLAKLHAELGELYLLLHAPSDAVAAFERAADLAGLTDREAELLAWAEYESAPDQHVLPDVVTPVWPDPERPAWQRRAASIFESAPLPVQHVLRAAADGSAEGWLLSGFAVAVAIALGVALLRGRNAGDLSVALEYPGELRGAFSVRVASRKGRFKKSEKELAGHRPSSRSQRYGVSREAHFPGLRSGEWFVTVEGSIEDATTGECIAEIFEERAVSVPSKRSERIAFDLAPPGCQVELQITWGDRPARDATVGIESARESLRYVRGGSVNLRLPVGGHRIVVGSNDRVVEAEVEIDGFGAREVAIDLSGSAAVVFKGCPPAVEPYMHGDIDAAAAALERDGQRSVAQAMLGRRRQQEGNLRQAAEHFEAAGLSREAAEIHERMSNHAHAAELLERIGDHKRAAELFSAAGEWARAGDAFEQAGDYGNAAACWGEARIHDRWARALERHGEAFDAARIALDGGDRGRAIALFLRVAPGDPHYVEACRQLADCYEAEGHHDLAAQKLQAALEDDDAADHAPTLRWRLALLLEETGEYERALAVLDDLRLSCPTYPNVATRIEALRKRVSAREYSPAQQILGQGGGNGTTPTAFLSDQRYELLEEIGRGGMGHVYRAHDKRLDRIVALKQLPQTLRDHPRAVELFLREAQSAARLNHRNVVTVYDTDQQDGTFFITMELLEGYPLNAILKTRGTLKVRDALKIGVQVCAGLEYAHAQRIVHRDIKTANLFFTRDKVVKIMDFGLAKMVEEVRRASTIVGGTPYYMAPEQGTGGEIDHRADLYAFGVTLFQLVTGELPFPDGDVTYKHRHVQPPDPRTLREDLPDDLAELILQMLEKDPEARPASAAEVGRRLEAMIRKSQATREGDR